MMRPRADAADARCDARQIFHRAPDAELLEAAQLDDINPCGIDVAGIVQLDCDFCMTFNTGDGLDHECLGGDDSPPGRRRPAPAKRLKVAARSGICFGSSPIEESAPIMSTMGLAFSESGPKQPSHGILARMQRGTPSLPPHPARVAGPRQRKPCSIRQRISLSGAPGVNSGASKRRLRDVTAFFSRLVGHSSHTLLVASCGSGFPCRRASNAFATISGVVGHPGKYASTGTISCTANTRSLSAGTCSRGKPSESV